MARRQTRCASSFSLRYPVRARHERRGSSALHLVRLLALEVSSFRLIVLLPVLPTALSSEDAACRFATHGDQPEPQRRHPRCCDRTNRHAAGCPSRSAWIDWYEEGMRYG